MNQPAQVVCVLGMHRSGTSCLTGSLQSAGLSLGNCHTWNQYNQKGNRENQAFVDLNDAILAANDGAWDDPPRRVRWHDEHCQRARELLSDHSGTGVFGFKDPRTLLLLEGWQHLCPQLRFVGTVRHPNAVAKSLENRSGMPRKQALDLWYGYNRILLQAQRRSGFPVLCFDETEAVFHAKLDGVIASLGLQQLDAGERFYEQTLKASDEVSAERLPWRVARLHRQLLKVCL